MFTISFDILFLEYNDMIEEMLIHGCNTSIWFNFINALQSIPSVKMCVVRRHSSGIFCADWVKKNITFVLEKMNTHISLFISVFIVYFQLWILDCFQSLWKMVSRLNERSDIHFTYWETDRQTYCKYYLLFVYKIVLSICHLCYVTKWWFPPKCCFQHIHIWCTIILINYENKFHILWFSIFFFLI